MNNLEKIKKFFIERQNKFVHYNVIDKEHIDDKTSFSEFVLEKIIHNPEIKSYFAFEFPFSSDDLITLDSMDSFVFDFYFLETADKIIITDAKRTFDCGVDCFEGNGVLLSKFDVVEKYLSKYDMYYLENAIYKQTSVDTFIQDTITFTKVLQTLNNAQPFPPFVLELDSAKDVVTTLTSAWVNDEKVQSENDLRKLALFDNNKTFMGDYCSENSFVQYFNKYAFVGVFFNSSGKVLVRKKLNDCKYNFAINDFILENETCSLESLQRAIRENFGFDFSFGEVAPSITTVNNHVITDYYVIKGYDVNVKELLFDSEKNLYSWISKDKLLTLISSGEFTSYPLSLIEYIYQL